MPYQSHSCRQTDKNFETGCIYYQIMEGYKQRQNQGRILGRGAGRCAWDAFAPLLKFSAPPQRTFAPPLIILTKSILKDSYTSLIKKYKMQT